VKGRMLERVYGTNKLRGLSSLCIFGCIVLGEDLWVLMLI